jgi:hypothetical protein
MEWLVTDIGRSRVVASGDRPQLRQNCLLGRRPHDFGAEIPVHKEKQRRNRLNVIPQAQIGVVVGVDPQHSHAPGTPSRDFIQHRLDNVTGMAPGRRKLDQHRLLRVQDFRLEVRAADLGDPVLAWIGVHFFNRVTDSASTMHRERQLCFKSTTECL